MSRLDYAPKLKEIHITDIKKGLGAFTPKPDRRLSFAALKSALKQAGYALNAAELTVVGTLAREGNAWVLANEANGQRFALEGANLAQTLAGIAPDERVEITGDWKTVGAGATARETIVPRDVKKEAKATTATTAASARATSLSSPSVVSFTKARYAARKTGAFAGAREEAVAAPAANEPRAPIRVTSPGLTVYKGGAIVPRLYFVRQHLGDLEVSRQTFDVSVSYTPTATLQLEAEANVSRVSFDDGVASHAGVGLGNVTLWGKYRFYRKVKTYGDRQAAVRFGLELPTGHSDAPDETKVNAHAFVRQQLTPIAGGLSPHFDAAFSQAGGRFIFGGNVEAVLRAERDGFRMGHEVRVNTDLEYVLLPFKYDTPGRELFVILETTFVRRGLGRLDSAVVRGSNATEYTVAPGLQYAADPRFVIEGSIQLPLVRRTGPLALRTDRNILLGVRYLF